MTQQGCQHRQPQPKKRQCHLAEMLNQAQILPLTTLQGFLAMQIKYVQVHIPGR